MGGVGHLADLDGWRGEKSFALSGNRTTIYMNVEFTHADCTITAFQRDGGPLDLRSKSIIIEDTAGLHPTTLIHFA
jgi:hypothetical protein